MPFDKGRILNQLKSIIESLSDCQFHSGQNLASRLNLSRTSIWNMIKQLQEYGIEIDSVRGKGYRLLTPIELICPKKIFSCFKSKKNFPELEHHFSLPSTNTHLMTTLEQIPTYGKACFTEHQTEGRGRRGKVWQTTFGSNLTFSYSREFQSGPQTMSGLSLVVALAVIQALKAYGLKDLSVKWPNDILVKGKKIAGILIELTGESQGPTKVVIGIGINGRMNKTDSQAITQPWTDITSETTWPFKRNLCASRVLESLLQHLQDFEKHGLGYFLTEWHRYDAGLNQRLLVQTPSGQIEGIGKGVNEQGHLLLQQGHQITQYSAGEVSLRNPYVTT